MSARFVARWLFVLVVAPALGAAATVLLFALVTGESRDEGDRAFPPCPERYLLGQHTPCIADPNPDDGVYDIINDDGTVVTITEGPR